MQPLNTHLPPVDCPLLIAVGDILLPVRRTTFVESKDRQMEYQLPTGEKIIGRYQWTYP